MTFLSRVEETAARVVACVGAALRALASPSVFLPLLIWIVARSALAIWLGGFPHPPRDQLAGLWVLAAGTGALHFPEAYAALPRVLIWIDPAVEFLIGVPVLLLAVRALPRVLDPDEPAADAPPLGAAWLASVPAVLGGGALLALSDRLAGLPTGGAAFQAAAVVASLCLRALLLFALPALVYGRRSAAGALSRSLGLSSGTLGETLSFVILAFCLTLPWRFDPMFFASTFWSVTPEWMAPWTAIGSVATVLGHWIAVGAAARWYLHVYGPGES